MNQHLKRLTLATTVHNNSQLATTMLQSFENCIGTCEEVVIVDDGSTEPYVPPPLQSPVRLIRNEVATGFCQAADKSLRNVNTDFALLADADVVFLPGDFSTGFNEFCDLGNWAWVNFLQVDFTGRPQRSSYKTFNPAWIFGLGGQVETAWELLQRKELCKTAMNSQRIVCVDIAFSSSTLVRMSSFHEIGGFDHWYWQAESDVDLSISFRRAGYGVGIDQGYTVMHEGIGFKTGGNPRIIDAYRAKLHLYEKFDPVSRLYLRSLLLSRHVVEVAIILLFRAFSKKLAEKLPLRLRMLRSVMNGY